MAMLGSGASKPRKNILDLIDSGQFESHLKAMNSATEARNKSAEDFRKAKADAEDAIHRLNLRRTEHSQKQDELAERGRRLDELSSDLNARLTQYEQDKAEFEFAKQEFETTKQEHQRVFKASMDVVASKDHEAKQKLSQGEQRLMSATQYEQELDKRESSVSRREQFLVDCADMLRRA